MFTLTREETTVQDTVNNRNQWAVKFTAAYSDVLGNPPAKIFVMQTAPQPDVFLDSLSCIASAIQMTDLPEDAAEEGSPFYRVAVVTKLCRSAEAAVEFVAKVKDAVQDLVDNLEAAQTLSVVETFTITPDI